MHWMHAIPIEGLLGRLLGDLLVHYLNYAGACIVALTAIAAAFYMVDCVFLEHRPALDANPLHILLCPA